MSENTEILLEKSYHFDRYLSSSNPGFQDLTLTEKALVREILSSKLDISSLNEIIYDRKPPTIEEFLKDPKYLGEHLNKQLYPIWKEEMAEYHDANNTQKEWILSGSSGSGKTTAARVSALYSIYRILCLRYPAQILNIIDSDLIVCSLLTLTLAKAELALIAPFVNMLNGSEMFEQVTSRKDFANYSGEKIPFQHSGSVIKLPKNFVIMPGSQESHAVGLNIPIAMLDEAEARGGGVSEILSMWAEIKTRINNRFKISRFTSLYMMSSSKTINGVVSSYMKNLRSGWQSRIRYTAKAVWEVKPKDYNLSGKTFPVLRGTPTHPSKILNGEEVLKKLNGTFTVPSNCDLLEIPVEFENEFYELGVNKALQDIVGITTNTDDMPFDFLDNLEVEFLPELFNLKAPAEDNKPLIELLPRNIFDDISGRLSRYWDAPRYCFTGDTKVKLLSGKSKTFLELLKDHQEGKVNYVYSWDNNVGWVSGKISNVFESGFSKEIYKITLDDGSFIRATGDHPFMLRNGEYKEVKNLRSGDSLMPMYTRKDSKGYEEIRDNNTNKYVKTHKISDEYLEFSRKKALARKKMLPKQKNHSILKIEVESLNELVYDLTVENVYNSHNFVVEGHCNNPKSNNSSNIVVSNCHLDLAVTSEAGISVCHKELTQEGRVVYVYDFICWVTADTRIDFLRIYDLFVDLKTKAQVNFEIISADQFQSTQIRQMLEKQKIATQVNYLSVDRTATAYDLLSKAVHKNEIKVGKCPYLKKQLENIGIDRTKNHVYTVERKDIADSFCGSYFNAFSNSNDIPTNLFKDQVSRNVVVDLTKYKRII